MKVTYTRRFANGDTQELEFVERFGEPVRNYRGDIVGFDLYWIFRTPAGAKITLPESVTATLERSVRSA